MPIITITMLHYDPKTYVVSFAEPSRPVRPADGQLGRVLAGFAAAGLATRLLEALLSRRPH